jgi:2-polyprenyl-6-methoxyphenol hydroxylase-like FAD-dependent oxidoreductase
MTEKDWETTQVLICGCGPTGALLAGYLCRMGISSIILEKEASIVTDPRGIVLDDDGIRFLQGLGLYKHIFAEIGPCIDRVKFIGGDHQDLAREPIFSIDIGTVRFFFVYWVNAKTDI